jgi:flavodoxin/ferredoxin
MKVQLAYYSGAGNTKFVAKLIENRLVQNGHIVKSIRLTEKNINSLDNDFDILYLGFPVYFRDAPKLVYKIYDKLSGKNRPIMIFLTKGLYSGNAIKNIYKVSLENKFVLKGFIELFMPGSDLLTSKIKEGSFSEKIFTGIHSLNIVNKVNNFVNKMEKNKIISNINNKWYTYFDELIVKKLEIKHNNSHKDWIEKLVANEEKCIKCMKCVNGCPCNNITCIDRIVFGKNCDVCLYCISNCPQFAINISEETINNVKYSEEKINKIFCNIKTRQTST